MLHTLQLRILLFRRENYIQMAKINQNISFGNGIYIFYIKNKLSEM